MVVAVLIVVAVVALTTPGAGAGTDDSGAAPPTVEGPVTGGKGTPQLACLFRLDTVSVNDIQ